MWRNFRFLHKRHARKAEISPHCKFFSTHPVGDKYQVCQIGIANVITAVLLPDGLLYANSTCDLSPCDSFQLIFLVIFLPPLRPNLHSGMLVEVSVATKNRFTCVATIYLCHCNPKKYIFLHTDGGAITWTEDVCACN